MCVRVYLIMLPRERKKQTEEDKKDLLSTFYFRERERDDLPVVTHLAAPEIRLVGSKAVLGVLLITLPRPLLLHVFAISRIYSAKSKLILFSPIREINFSIIASLDIRMRCI